MKGKCYVQFRVVHKDNSYAISLWFTSCYLLPIASVMPFERLPSSGWNFLKCLYRIFLSLNVRLSQHKSHVYLCNDKHFLYLNPNSIVPKMRNSEIRFTQIFLNSHRKVSSLSRLDKWKAFYLFDFLEFFTAFQNFRRFAGMLSSVM